MKQAPFFILGNPRSGTSLFRLMLNSHPEIVVPPECGFLQWWYRKYKNWNKNCCQDLEVVKQYCNDVLSSKKIENWNIAPKALINQIKLDKPASYAELSVLVYKQYNTKKKGLVGDKNNYYIQHLNLLDEIYPSTKYIHLVRDGRDVASSYLKLSEQKLNSPYTPQLPSKIEDIAVEWQANVILIDDFLNSKEGLVIKYEDLVKNPQKTLKEVTDFLGVAFSKDMFLFYKKEYHDEPQSTMGWKGKTLERLDGSNTQNFLEVLTKEEVFRFSKLAKVMLDKYGYL